MQDPTMPPTAKDLSKMKELTETAMKEGAFGISTGLEYVPGRFADMNELVELAKIAGKNGGFYASHIRDEQVGVLDAIAEAIEVGAKSGTSVQISHVKACGAEVWGYGQTISSMISLARSLGVDVTADQYPYAASSTGFSQAFPSWALEGGIEKLKERLADPALSSRIRAYAKNQIGIRVGNDLSLIQIASYKANSNWEGKTMADILKERGKEPTLDKGIDLVIEMYLSGGPSIIYHYINLDDIKVLMRNPYVMVASDGDIREYGSGAPHPRNYGSFPRVLSYYVKDQYILTMEEAIKKMTSMPAKKLSIKDRGVIKPGNWADIVIFNENEIKDTATFFNPHQYPLGIKYVIVNGTLTAKDGKHTGKATGKVLYGPGKIGK